jgi:hypothetical protein
MAMQQYPGSCHCGAIRFSFEAESFTHGVRLSTLRDSVKRK